MTEPANNLNQIRDLLLGQQLDAYERRFQQCGDRLEQIEDTLSEFRGQIKLQLQQLENTISEELINLNQGLESKLKYFTNASNTELSKLEQMLNAEADSFSQELNTFQRDFSQRYSAMKEDLEALRQNLTQQLTSVRSDVVNRWHVNYSEMNEGKLSKDQLGKMLFEFSLKTRDGSFLPELPQGTQTQIEAELES